jgi:enamine deaminase RidA (YjgF/YER057c/UK114 family)
MPTVSIPSPDDVLHATAAPALPAAAEPSDLGVPPWVTELFGGSAHPAAPEPDVRVTGSAAFTLVTVRKANAAALDPASFEACTRSAYATIAQRLRDARAAHPVRFWNYIPDIHRPCGAGLDRYMAFNAGRFAACSDWFGGPDTFDRMLATGSGVGHAGPDLVIHALATDAPGVAVENPRQIPAYRYSRRFGPRPPCFARATVIGTAAPLVLVGGTASIRGEESVHVGDLRAQTLETFENLASLVRSAAGVAGCGGDAGPGAFRELRVYHFRDADRAPVAELVRSSFPGVARVEYLRADLCRPELAVEIEGVAELKPRP